MVATTLRHGHTHPLEGREKRRGALPMHTERGVSIHRGGGKAGRCAGLV